MSCTCAEAEADAAAEANGGDDDDDDESVEVSHTLLDNDNGTYSVSYAAPAPGPPQELPAMPTGVKLPPMPAAEAPPVATAMPSKPGPPSSTANTTSNSACAAEADIRSTVITAQLFASPSSKLASLPHRLVLLQTCPVHLPCRRCHHLQWLFPYDKTISSIIRGSSVGGINALSIIDGTGSRSTTADCTIGQHHHQQQQSQHPNHHQLCHVQVVHLLLHQASHPLPTWRPNCLH